ncbi:MAG: cytochrome c-type biogenesis protein CcmH [Rhodospirillaceae bacterium]|nr:cytochrome c-type biogenesis protein CcmH [Rhodospirillales bacterium]
MRRLLLTLAVLQGVVAPAFAVDPREMLADPALEHRAREIGKELRCLVCQNQSIDDSDADLARDLRIIVRERLKTGETDSQVMGFVTARYGDYVLLKPPFKLSTYALWFGPLVIFAAAVLAVFTFYRRSAAPAESVVRPLSDEEQQQVEFLLKEQPKS